MLTIYAYDEHLWEISLAYMLTIYPYDWQQVEDSNLGGG